MSTEFGRLLAEVLHSMESGTGFEKLKAVMDIYERNLKLEARIDKLEEAQRWIPVIQPPSLREKKVVLVYTKSCEIYSGMYFGNNEWTGLERDFREGEVTHWMPLPQPPEVQE